MQLLGFVGLYLLWSICVGLYAASKVKNSADYVIAGRRLPLPFIIATVFATWFGAEVVLGIPATFLNEGLAGVIADPFGAATCLVLVGLFFARPLYRMGLLTIGDYYRKRYNRTIEVATSLCIILSYLGWVSAQVTAMGLVFSVLSHGALQPWQGMCIGLSIVMIYTLTGGMLSVAFTDLFDMSLVVGSMLYIAYVVSGLVGGPGVVIEHAQASGKFNFWPALTARDVIAFVAAWSTMALGSIPQQDVFQRVAAAKDERTAGRGSVMGGCLYFIFAFIPMYLAYSALLVDPVMVGQHIDGESQHILPLLILQHTPLFVQVLFFGALTSAILSCSAATLLAPSVTFAENIVRPLLPKMRDRHFLLLLRATVLVFALSVLAYSLLSQQSIYSMVENAYQVTLVAAFAPLAFGLYWKRATTQGALLSVIGGLATWLSLMFFHPDGLFPPQFGGLLVSIIGMLLGSLLPQRYGVAANTKTDKVAYAMPKA